MEVPVLGGGYLLMSCWSVALVASQNNKGSFHLSCCPPELDNKTLFLKIPHILDSWSREIKLELILKFLPCWLAFIVLRVAMQTCEGEKTSLVLSSTRPCCNHCHYMLCAYWCNSGMSIWDNQLLLWLDLELTPLEGNIHMMLEIWLKVFL